MNKTKWITLKESATLSKFPTSYVRQLANSNIIKSKKEDGILYILEDSIKHFIKPIDTTEINLFEHNPKSCKCTRCFQQKTCLVCLRSADFNDISKPQNWYCLEHRIYRDTVIKTGKYDVTFYRCNIIPIITNKNEKPDHRNCIACKKLTEIEIDEDQLRYNERKGAEIKLKKYLQERDLKED